MPKPARRATQPPPGFVRVVVVDPAMTSPTDFIAASGRNYGPKALHVKFFIRDSDASDSRLAPSPMVDDDRPPRLRVGSGPGTEFQRLISWIPALVPWWSKESCSCRAIRRRMDVLGPDWCDKNLTRLAATIKKSAVSGGVWLPFMEPAIRKLLAHAIQQSRMKQNGQGI